MPTFGVTPQGFVRKTLRDILDSLTTSQRSTISATLDISSDTFLGQVNGIFARELGIGWENLEVLYHANDPDAVENLLLTMLCKLTGTLRRPASPSVVTLTCNLDNGTTLVAGTHFASTLGQSGVRWTPQADYTSPGDGSHDVVFVNEKTGPIEGPNGTIIVIATPVTGWNSVTNALDAAPGRVADDDPSLRARRDAELATVGSTTARAIRANLVSAFDAIETCSVFENDTDYVDGVTGNPPHSLEVLIWDGDSPDLGTNNAIAQVIWNNKAGGIQTTGTSSGTATVDDAGTTKTVYFTRASVLNVYLVYVLVTDPAYVGDSTLKALIATNAKATFGPNQTVRAEIVKAMALPPNAGVAGVTDITTFTLGLAPSPVGTINVPVGLRQIARFDPSRVAITSS